ncbi:MAG: DUF4398 domain-containing protein [Thermodesulfobacteria bacterium]|nr:DUF4398 domain-containing protein [Thermodesulfobacteriota bacterium]
MLISLLITGFTLPPKLAEKLSRLPWIGQHLKVPQPPEKEKKEAEEALSAARLAGAPQYAPEKWQMALKIFERAQTYFREGKYRWAQATFEKAKQKALEAKEAAEKKREELRQRALEKYEQLLGEIEDLKAEDLSLRIRLRYLRGLIDQEDFETFDEEFRRLRQEIQKLKKGPKTQKGA